MEFELPPVPPIPPHLRPAPLDKDPEIPMVRLAFMVAVLGLLALTLASLVQSLD